MSDYFYSTGYDAGAVIDMNNLAIGYFPPSRAHCMPTSLGPTSAPQPPLPQPPAAAPAVPAAASETIS
jgi:hypothetical protein